MSDRGCHSGLKAQADAFSCGVILYALFAKDSCSICPEIYCQYNYLTGVPQFGLDSQWENFKLFGLIYYVYPKKFELFWAWLLKKRVGQHQDAFTTVVIECTKALTVAMSRTTLGYQPGPEHASASSDPSFCMPRLACFGLCVCNEAGENSSTRSIALRSHGGTEGCIQLCNHAPLACYGALILHTKEHLGAQAARTDLST